MVEAEGPRELVGVVGDLGREGGRGCEGSSRRGGVHRIHIHRRTHIFTYKRTGLDNGVDGGDGGGDGGEDGRREGGLGHHSVRGVVELLWCKGDEVRYLAITHLLVGRQCENEGLRLEIELLEGRQDKRGREGGEGKEGREGGRANVPSSCARRHRDL